MNIFKKAEKLGKPFALSLILLPLVSIMGCEDETLPQEPQIVHNTESPVNKNQLLPQQNEILTDEEAVNKLMDYLDTNTDLRITKYELSQNCYIIFGNRAYAEFSNLLNTVRSTTPGLGKSIVYEKGVFTGGVPGIAVCPNEWSYAEFKKIRTSVVIGEMASNLKNKGIEVTDHGNNTFSFIGENAIKEVDEYLMDFGIMPGDDRIRIIKAPEVGIVTLASSGAVNLDTVLGAQAIALQEYKKGNSKQPFSIQNP